MTAPDVSQPGRALTTTLGISLQARAEAWGVAALLLLYYALSMSRDLSFFDSAELAMVAAQGGLGHPTGQPLHTGLGYVFARLPGLSALVGLNLLSALPTALSVVPICSLAEGLVDRPLGRGGRLMLAGVAGALLLHPVFWENGSRVEVYALALLCTLWATARLVDALRASRGFWAWFPAGVGYGLAAAANPYVPILVVVSAGPAVLWALRRRAGRAVLGLGGVLGAITGGVVGLLPYLYIPLVAGRDAFVWGAPLEGEALWFYLSGADFGSNRGLDAATWAGQVWAWARWAVAHDFAPVVAVGGVAWILWSRALLRWVAPGALALTVLLITNNVVFYPDVPDYLGYLAAPMAFFVAGCAAMAARLWADRPGLAVTLGVVLVGSVAVAHPAVWSRTRHRDVLARTMAEGVLKAAPQGGLVMVDTDHWVFPLLYLQEIEGLRPDVVVWAGGLSSSSWWWDRLYMRHPDLVRFPLRGAGGWIERGRRFLSANPARVPRYEDWRLAVLLGRPGCAGPWLLKDARGCTSAARVEAEDLAPAVAASVARLGEGSPTADRVAARLSAVRGEVLWRLGAPKSALVALRSGIPPELAPAIPGDLSVEGAGQLRGPPRRWAARTLVGHPRQNLFLAGELLWRAGARAASTAYVQAAAELGLPEALEGR